MAELLIASSKNGGKPGQISPLICAIAVHVGMLVSDRIGLHLSVVGLHLKETARSLLRASCVISTWAGGKQTLVGRGLSKAHAKSGSG
jgi:hypothetical protein